MGKKVINNKLVRQKSVALLASCVSVCVCDGLVLITMIFIMKVLLHVPGSTVSEKCKKKIFFTITHYFLVPKKPSTQHKLLSDMSSSSILVVITGASRGIGRSCAISFAKYANNKTSDVKKIHFCLIARNVDGLEETAKLVHQTIHVNSSTLTTPTTTPTPTPTTTPTTTTTTPTTHDGDDNNSSNNNEESNFITNTDHPEITTFVQKVDLADLDTLEETIQNMMNQQVVHQVNQGSKVFQVYDHCILINNAGSLGHLGKAKDISSPKDIQTNIHLNIASSCWLSSYFLKWFDGITEQENGTLNAKCTVVNISSLCAISSFPTMAMYCAGKAYRDMFHQTMAKEEQKGDSTSSTTTNNSDNSDSSTSTEPSSNRNIQILNYAPGAIETDMTETLSQSNDLDSNLSQFYKKRDETMFVKVEDSTRKLVNLVMDGNYESGKHIDFWDDIDFDTATKTEET